MSKKIMSIMLAVFMLASLCVVGMTSASAAVKPATVVDGQCAHAGDIIEFTMAVDLDGCWGQNGQMTTYYDSSKLKFLKYTNDQEKAYTYPVISASGSFMPNLTGGYGTDDNGYVGLHVNYTDAIGGYDYSSAKGVVLRYKFEVLEDVNNLSELIYNSIDVFKVFTVPGDPEYAEGAIGTEVDLVANGTLDKYLIGGGMTISGGYSEETTDPSESDTTEEPTASDTTEATDPSESDTTEEPTASDTTEATDPSESDTTEEPTASDTTEATDPSESDTTEEPTASVNPTTSTTKPTSSTTDKPDVPQTGETSTAVVLMVAAIMAAGVVIFARKKAVK